MSALPRNDELCALCKFTFESHQWFTPKGYIAVGTTHAEGHDWTSKSGESVTHPRFARPAEELWELFKLRRA